MITFPRKTGFYSERTIIFPSIVKKFLRMLRTIVAAAIKGGNLCGSLRHLGGDCGHVRTYITWSVYIYIYMICDTHSNINARKLTSDPVP